MAIQAKNLRPGDKIMYEKDAWQVTEATHRTPGNLRAFVQVRLRHLIHGRTTDTRFSSTESIEEANTENRKMQFLFKDESGYTFMDLESYEQMVVPRENLGNAVNYLLENAEVIVQFLEGKIIGMDLPAAVELVIVETEPGVKGDTVNNVTKPAKMQTGVVVQVPIFVNEGEKIRVDTRSGEYLGRA